MNFEPLQEHIMGVLEKELSGSLYYHTVGHTLDVVEAAGRIATAEKLGLNDIMCIRTAALLHDSGMIRTYDGHEAASAEIARNVLPEFDYSADQIEMVCSMIMETEMRRSPTGIREQVIRDADLDYLGRADYFVIAQKLRLEWQTLGIRSYSLKEWYRYQLVFLEGHRYNTLSANNMNNRIKQENINQIKELLQQ